MWRAEIGFVPVGDPVLGIEQGIGLITVVALGLGQYHGLFLGLYQLCFLSNKRKDPQKRTVKRSIKQA